MDPNENLKEQRAIIAELGGAECQCACAHQAKLERLVELVMTLDMWLEAGGFLPDAWARRAEKDGPAILGSDLRGIRF